MSMHFNERWQNDLDFDVYVAELKNESFIDRQWLQKEIEKEINSPYTGILLVANMGYGKSSVVSNIICASKTSPWNSLRQTVLSYHMCRHDVILSTKPEVFIRNLAGKIVKDVPALGNSILSDDRALEFLYGKKCKEDPISCLEFAIINPLKSSPQENSYLIIVDALDECETRGSTSLVNLLYKKLSFFPRNIKFLFTTRNIENILYKFRELKHVLLESYEKQNIADINSYIATTSKLSNLEASQLIKVAGRSFLHVKLYLHHCKEIGTDHCIHIPDNLEKIYFINFERVFGTNAALFEQFIHIFEVLCSLQNPIEVDKLLKIAGVNTDERMRHALRILGNELRHFVKSSDGKISFQHKSLSDFLTNTSRKHLNFYVDEKNGHKLFAEFLLSSLNLSKEDNLLDVAHHVVLSGQTEYEDILINYVSEVKTEKMKIVSNFTYLREAARRINHYNTIALLIKLVESDDVKNRTTDHNDYVKNNMSLAAFIAAANGNDESLKAFVNHGANIRYKHFDSKTSDVLFFQNDLIFSCKYIFLCGYNILHITAQKGYAKIVKYLLDQDQTLLLEKNSLLLNAFQLAAEHGHVSVMDEILKRDKSFADAHSLHHASENGHSNAVAYLLHHVQDTCVPCNGSLNWRSYNIQEYRDQTFKNLGYTYHNKGFTLTKNFFETYAVDKHNVDDWRLVTCDTALNVAVRNGYIETVKVFLNKSVNAINCTAHDGSNALMTAVKYNRTDIFKLLYLKGSDIKLKCLAVQINRSRLFPFEAELLEKRKCPENSSIEHLFAIYDNIEIVRFLIDQGHNAFNWKSQDTEGLTPLHYAFCHNSFNFINYFIFDQKKFDLNITASSHNGSTPFHSAAVCRSSVLHRYVKGIQAGQLNKIPDIFDNQNISILQYGLNVSMSAEDLIRIGQTGYDEFTHSLFEMSVYLGHNFQHTDIYGRNFLHYAALSGNYLALLVFSSIKKYEQDIGLLLNMKDKNHRTPLELSFDALPKRNTFESVKIPHNCSLGDVFYKTCNANLSVLLSPHEYFIFIVFQHLHFKGNIFQTNITDLLIISIRKSRIYPILILKTYAEQYFINAISNSTEIPSFISTFDIPLIGELILNVDRSLRCNTTNSPLHRIIRNDRISLWNFHSLTFLDPLFKLYTSSYLDHCYDDEGYNLLHLAVKGGNHLAFSYLEKNGLSVWIPSKKNESLLKIAVLTSPYMKNGFIPSYYPNGSRFHVLEYIFQNEQANILYDNGENISFDETAMLILSKLESNKKMDGTQIKNEICKNKTHDLGLVHIAAAKGLLTFLIKVNQMYGVDIMKCEDFFGVTPLYLAYIYNQTHVVSWMKKLKCILKEPTQESKNVLIYNLIDNYETIYDWTCTLIYRNTVLLRRQVGKCVNNMRRSILYSSVYKNPKFVFNILHNLVRQFISDERITVNNFVLSTLVQCLKRKSQCVYPILRELMLFGFDDKKYYYIQFLGELDLNKLKSKSNQRLYAKLFLAIYRNKYSHYKKLQMRMDLHHHWLKDSDLYHVNNITHYLQLRGLVELKRLMVLNERANVSVHMCSDISLKINVLYQEMNTFSDICSSCVRELVVLIYSVTDDWSLVNAALQFHAIPMMQKTSWKQLARYYAINIGKLFKDQEHFEILNQIRKILRGIQHLPDHFTFVSDFWTFLNFLLIEMENIHIRTEN